ncbi:MAG: hypothetical protein AAB250_09740 [Bdellovibrionota bacterium]
MRSFVRSFLIVSSLALCVFAFDVEGQARGSKPLSPDDQKALQETQEMLRDRSQVEAFAAKDPNAKGADEMVKSLMGPDSGKAYDLAADIFADLVRQAEGDPGKLMQLIQNAQKNPEKFATQLSPSQKTQMKALAAGVEKRQVASPPK